MSRFAARILLGFGLLGTGLSSPAWAQRLELVPFADIRQTGIATLKGDRDDSVTYTELSTGLAARTNTRRIVASLGYVFSYRIAEAGRNEKSSQHNGEGRVQIELIKNMLTIEGGGLATQSRVDAGGASQQFANVSNNNLTQTYSGYIQPVTRHHVGDLDLTASYRFGYVKNEGRSPNALGVPTDRFDSSTNQTGLLQAGMGIGALPFEWTLSGQYQREDASALDQKFLSYTATLQVKVPIADTVAFVASSGYETNRQSTAQELIDPLTGVPVIDSSGRFVADPTKPRVLTYDQEGLIGDAGVIWRPSRRTRLEARVGRRYGGLTYSGLLEMQPDEQTTLNVIVSDRLNSFGRSVTNGLASAPVQLDFNNNDPQTAYQTCLFGVRGNGTCLGGALGQAAATSYRDRSLTAIYTHRLKRLSISLGGGYTRRTYIDDPNSLFSLDGVVDQLFYMQGSGTLAMSRDAGLSFAFSANWFKNGQVGVGDVISYSVNTTYYRLLFRNLRAEASLGLESSKQDGSTADMSGRAQLGVHYDF